MKLGYNAIVSDGRSALETNSLATSSIPIISRKGNGILGKYVSILRKNKAREVKAVSVGNIPYDATEEQLIQICEEVGPVVSFRLVIDRETGKPKGYGFCEYKDEETALSARRNLQGYEINGRQLRVDFAENDKGADRNREQGRGGPGMAANVDPQKQVGGPAILGDSAHQQPIGLPLAMAAASVMAGALGGPQVGSKTNQNGLQSQLALSSDPLTLQLAKMSRNQLNEILSELKVNDHTKEGTSSATIACKPTVAKSSFSGTDNARNGDPTSGLFHYLKLLCYYVLFGTENCVTERPFSFFELCSCRCQIFDRLQFHYHSLYWKMENSGQQLAVHTLPGLPPLAQNKMQFAVMPKVQEGQASAVPQHSLFPNQFSTLPQPPTQPRIQIPQLGHNQVQQTTLPGQSGVLTHPSIRPQPLPSLSVRPQIQMVTSSSLKQQMQPPLLQHPGQVGASHLGHNTQLGNPNATLQPSLMTRPLISDPGFQPGSSSSSGISETTNKDADRSIQVTNNTAWAHRINTYSNVPSGPEKINIVRDNSEPINRPSKLVKLDDGRSAPFPVGGLNVSTVTGSEPSHFFGIGLSPANQIPKAEEASPSEKQVPQSQLPADVQSALLQQVMNLTPEQLSSLPPEQQQQVIQLQQMLR
ncbi:hypothetical protein L1049_025455 [Liquidambar formosana]|uniref:RRM domain-containing protein n=1 Tax=Liquidambar formosana TaxID=63359 RepID=A0AAP0NAY1_LIQFO